jgi:autoinducer 2-degrading protein
MSSSNIIVKCVEVRVKNEHLNKFIEVTKLNCRNTRKESGNLRFEIHQCIDDPTVFFFFEAYKNQAAINLHKATSYYKEWCAVAEPLMIGARQTHNCKIIFSDQL